RSVRFSMARSVRFSAAIDRASQTVEAVIRQVVEGRSATSEEKAEAVPAARRLLGSTGLKVSGGRLFLSNHGSRLHEQLERRWPERQWLPLLREIPGVKPARQAYFSPSLTSRGSAIPLGLLMPFDPDPVPDPEDHHHT
ncbi:MAG: hypothetical protein OXI18_00435, partial [bacterium]|nr:hypothetical protein [bacterium]